MAKTRKTKAAPGGRKPLPHRTGIVEARPVYKPIFLKEWIEHFGKEQKEVARGAAISEGQLTLMLQGKRQYTQRTLESLAKFLGIETRMLFYHPSEAPIASMTPEDRERILRIMEAMRTPPKSE
jgi:transcriptional regulator with XRE-family HTH domain